MINQYYPIIIPSWTNPQPWIGNLRSFSFLLYTWTLTITMHLPGKRFYILSLDYQRLTMLSHAEIHVNLRDLTSMWEACQPCHGWRWWFVGPVSGVVEAGLPARAQRGQWLVISPRKNISHWIGLRENLKETMVFTIKYGGFPVNFPVNQSNESGNGGISQIQRLIMVNSLF